MPTAWPMRPWTRGWEGVFRLNGVVYWRGTMISMPKHLSSALSLCCGVLLALALAALVAPSKAALAANPGNVGGWIWNDSIGWISVSSTNPNACNSPPCGTYSVTADVLTHQITGFGWNDAVGWICFGTSCKTPACSPAGVPSVPPVGALGASINSGSGNPPVVGWAKICGDSPSRGWISLNCLNQGSCSSISYGVRFNPALKRFGDVDPDASSPPTYTSFGWNQNSDGTGIGWTEFSRMTLITGPEICDAPANTDTSDEDFNGKAGCDDIAACGSLPECGENTEVRCSNGVDDDGDGLIDCRDPGCSATNYCQENKNNRDTCSNGFDDDQNGLIDCSEPACAGAAGCALVGEPACMGIPGDTDPAHADTCCSDLADNDGANGTDCADTNCQVQAPSCNAAWLQFKFGNVYSQQGIQGAPHQGSTPNATYCLTTKGTVSGFTSQSGCTETGSASLSLPSAAGSFRGSLGNLDVSGILAGKYGKVVTTWAPPTTLPASLAGQVYLVNGDFTLSTAQTFANAAGAATRGSGLLVVNGGNLTITKNLSYAASTGVTIVRNLASLGVIVLKNGNPLKGNINIDGGVTQLVGAYFAEGTVKTCASGNCAANYLDVFGLMAARQFDFGRTKGGTTRGAEAITFDGRSVINPPPGMQDVGKSLPSLKDAF